MASDRRFSGLERLYGSSAAVRIRQSHVVVVGLGGVGSWAAESLARSGVGQLTLVDMDHVAESNINRQIHATLHTLGQAKVQAMRERMQSYVPECRVNCIDEFVSETNWPAILPAGVDAVIDACDQWYAKVHMASWALKTSCLHISCGAAGGKRHASQARIDDLSRVTHDPLLSKVRQSLRKNHGAQRDGKAMGVCCVYSAEEVSRPYAQDGTSCKVQDSQGLNCQGFGSVVSVTATFGHFAAGYILARIAEGVTSSFSPLRSKTNPMNL